MDTAQIIRTSHVKRWQIVRTARQQTLAEHSYLVAMLTIQICKRLFLGEELQNSCLMLALYHDTPEVETGDIATPVKAKIDYNDFGIITEYDQIKLTSSDLAIRIVKIADIIEAIIFLGVEGMGNHASTVSDKLHDHLDDLIKTCSNAYPECNWSVVNTIKWEGKNV